jgi:hypothetical protein
MTIVRGLIIATIVNNIDKDKEKLQKEIGGQLWEKRKKKC